jgi:uncharacterized repeat protein (TIGR04138 family)
MKADLTDELQAIAEKNGAYPFEAFQFLWEAFKHSQRMFDKHDPRDGETPGAEHHVSGRELLEGICDLARRDFGLMAPVVFERWGIKRTDDFGELVFALFDGGILSKTESDRKEDYQNVFELEPALTGGYRILEESDSGWQI